MTANHGKRTKAKITRRPAAPCACALCPRRCGVDRRAGERGWCGAGPGAEVFFAGVETAGETALVPTLELKLAGCNLDCAFCLSAEAESGYRKAEAGVEKNELRFAAPPATPGSVSELIARCAGKIKSVTISGGEPTVSLAGALELARLAPVDLPLVWKTNLYLSAGALGRICRAADVVLADFKFGNDDCAARLARVDNYSGTIRRNLRRAAEQARRLMVRHLALPGHVECCFRPVLAWMSENLPATPLLIMTGFLPLHRSHQFPELNRLLDAGECRQIAELAAAGDVTLADWTLAKVDPELPGTDVEIRIDPTGRVFLDSASASLAPLLAQLTSGGQAAPAFAVRPAGGKSRRTRKHAKKKCAPPKADKS